MIYSKVLQHNIPVTIKAQHYDHIPGFPKMTNYDIFDGKIKVGYVSLSDLSDGCYVDFVENTNPQMYKGFGAFADQLEVEHCIEREIYKPKIRSCAALNSHALHYLRGKRFNEVLDAPSIKRLMEKFGSVDVNEIVRQIIEKTPKDQMFDTKDIGNVRMYMPKTLVEYYTQLSKKSPVLTNVKHEYLG